MLKIDTGLKPAWLRDPLFSDKPTNAPFGYTTKKEAYGQPSLEELKSAIQCEEASIHAVWTPEHCKLTPASEVPALLEVLKPRRIKQAESQLSSSRKKMILWIIPLVALSLIALLGGHSNFYKDPTIGMLALFTTIFGIRPVYDAWKSLKNAQSLDLAKLSDEALDIRFDLWLSKQKVFFTRALTFLIVGLAIVQYLTKHPVLSGFEYTARLAGLININDLPEQEFWRLWTAPFLHGNEIHLLFNASALWYLGKRVEVLAKWPHLLTTYLLSALAGAYASIHFLPPSVPGVGASGGIMGLLGFLLIFELMHPKLSPKPARRRLIAAICMTGVIGLIGIQFVDNAAHAGGLVAGMAYAGIAFRKSDSAQRPRLGLADWVLGIGSLILILQAIAFTFFKISE